MPPRKRKAVDDDPQAAYHAPTPTSYAYAYTSSYGAPAASQSVSAVVIAPKAKKQRKAKEPNAPVLEKRAAIFKKSCPKNILERVERVMSQRFYMIDRRREGDELREEFSVLGSTGNVYTTIIDKKPSCNCPDALKGNHCKHILFIFLKVLQVTQTSGYWYQKALLTSELENIFAHAPRAPSAIAHDRIRNAYAAVTGKAVATGSQSNSKKRLPGEEDDCPVCYENMHNVNEKSLAFCEECGNGLHKECFQQWANTQTAKTGEVTCVFCRAKWVAPVVAGAKQGRGGAQTSEGYLNLSAVAGLSTVRDTSSYYQGPSRGRRSHGYREYNDYL